MNRKNRKEKEQNTDVSKQICVHKTQNTLLELIAFADGRAKGFLAFSRRLCQRLFQDPRCHG